MAVAHDAVSESGTGTTGVASVASFTWNHVPTGTPRSALVFTLAIGANPVTGVTYGGVAMTAVPYTAYDSDTEPGFVQAWFLDNVAAGTQQVVVSRTNNAVVTYATCFTQTAAKKCEVYLAGVKTRAGSAAEQTAASTSGTGVASAWASMALDDGSPGTDSIRYMAIHSGASSVSAASTNTTTNGTSASIDFGLYCFFTMRETTPSQGSKTLTIATSISDDLAVIGLAIREDPNARNASITATGGGVAVTPATKGATLAGTFTAGGVAVLAPKGAHTKAVTATGGGVLTSSSGGQRKGSVTATGGGVLTSSTRKGAQLAAVATGGGVAVVTGVKLVIDNRNASVTATAGGVAVLDARKGAVQLAVATAGGVAVLAPTGAHKPSVTATGGGILTSSSRKGAQRAVNATGGGVAAVGQKGGRAGTVTATGAGVASLSARSARLLAAQLSGGGVLTYVESTARRSSVAGTGGGVVVVTAVAGTPTPEREASITATGGGVATLTSSTQRAAAVAATGAGTASLAVSSARQLALLLTGGGIVALDALSGRWTAVNATGGGVVDLDGHGAARAGLAAVMRITDAGGAPVVAAPSEATVTYVSDAPVITSARFIP